MASEPKDIAGCKSDSDCVIVPYSHCCGSTKRAINKKYEADYRKHKDWQKFDDPAQCAVMGACISDKDKTKVSCVMNRECQLQFPEK